MRKFLKEEKERQAQLKNTSNLFGEAAKRDGLYKKKPRPFCLPEECASENLFAAVREKALKYFESSDLSEDLSGSDRENRNVLVSRAFSSLSSLCPFGKRA